MAAVIKLPVEHVWTGASAIFYDLLEYLVEHITQPDSLARSLAFGLHSWERGQSVKIALFLRHDKRQNSSLQVTQRPTANLEK